ncbi:MAG: PorT family protein [Chitinophagaceae bacterium]|jgi:hypothetical protein|nr:PorT family protein [Chitinophagaceae bacterium]
MKLRLLVLLLTLMSLGSQAQFLKVGPKAGANLLKIEGQSFEEGFELGYYVGGFLEIKTGKRFYLQPELLFSETQMHTSNDFRSIYRDLLQVDSLRTIKFQSLAIPVTLNWRVANVLALSAGPQFSINMNKSESLLKNAETAITNGDIALMLGANIMISKLRVHGRYMWGIRNQSNLKGGEAWKRQTLQLGLGFVF